MEFKLVKWNIEEMTGYKPITTYYEDFSIADNFGVSAIKDTYRRSLEYAKTNYKVLTELVMVLNWKIWEFYGKKDEYANVYNDLWEQLDAYACSNLKGEELDYFYRTTD